MRKLTYAVVGLSAVIGQAACDFLRLQFPGKAEHACSNILFVWTLWFVVVMFLSNDKS